MHQDIEKLLNAAKEKGSITEKQREIILNKAQQLGEDMAEVEFELENIPLKKNETTSLETKRCPNCGAIVDHMNLKCPDCGYSFNNELDVHKEVREIIEDLEQKLNATKSLKHHILKDVDIISSFKVPFTQGALIQAYEYAYSRYEASKLWNENISGAWLGKCKEFYGLIESQPNKDNETKKWLENNEGIKKALPIPKWAIPIILVGLILPILIVIFEYLKEI